jgi:hypothetical protein
MNHTDQEQLVGHQKVKPQQQINLPRKKQNHPSQKKKENNRDKQLSSGLSVKPTPKEDVH